VPPDVAQPDIAKSETIPRTYVKIHLLVILCFLSKKVNNHIITCSSPQIYHTARKNANITEAPP
jgi:hypothetical protein